MDGFHEPKARISSMPLMLALALILRLSTGCGAAPLKRVYLVAENRSVSGTLVPGKDVDLSALELSLISPDGVRTSAESATFDAKTGSFSFLLLNKDLHRPEIGSLLDNILRMGGALPSVEAPGGVSLRRVQSYARFEFRPKNLLDVAYQTVPYLQEILPLSQANTLRGVDRIQLSGGVALTKTGFARVRVFTGNGVPVPNATVAAVTDGQYTSGSPLWHDKALRPILTTTNADGTAFIGPIDPSENSKFKVLAYAPGYCSYLSSPDFIYSPRETSGPVIKLLPCGTTDTGVSQLFPVFPTGLRYFNVTERGQSRLKLHVNNENIKLQVHQSDLRFRGLRVAAYEASQDYEKRGEPIGKIYEFPSGAGEIEVPIGKKFISTDQENGNFVIEVSRIPGRFEGEALDTSVFPDLLIYGYKNVIAPPLSLLLRRTVSRVFAAFAENVPPSEVLELSTFKIRSLSGFENIVPGLPGTRFEMSSDKCGEGYSIGFSVDLFGISRSQPVFKDCINNKAVFTAEEAQFIAKKDVIEVYSSPQKWMLYLRDPYGNFVKDLVESGDTPNVHNVFIDSGVPKFGAGTESHAPNGAFQIGLLDLAGSFPAAPKNKIDKSDLLDGKGSFAIRFAEESVNSNLTCILNTDLDKAVNGGGQQGARAEINGRDGIIYRDEFGNVFYRRDQFSQLGYQITHFKIGANAESVRLEVGKAPSELPGLSPCRRMKSGKIVPNHVVIKPTDIVFPQDPNGAAEFFLSGMDSSGLVSEPGRYLIPKCTGGDEPSPTLCWEP